MATHAKREREHAKQAKKEAKAKRKTEREKAILDGTAPAETFPDSYEDPTAPRRED